MLSFWKNMLSNVYLGFFGADAILANAKAWDLVLWKCPRHSTTVRSHLICFNFLYFHWKVNTFKTSEMCLYLESDVWAGWFTIIFAWPFHYFKLVSCPILVCENVTGIPRPFDQLPSNMGKVNTFKTPEMRLYFDSDIWGGCLNYFCWIFSLLSFLPKLKVKWDESSWQKIVQ